MIVVQHIQTEWTKKSRGMPGAAVRNAVPKALPVPPFGNQQGVIFIHEIHAWEHERFRLREHIDVNENSLSYWTLKFVSLGESVVVEFTYDHYRHGRPNRGAYRRPLFTLGWNEFGVVRINGRHAGYYGQYYSQHVVNIANVAESTEDMFLKMNARHVTDMMDNLF